MSPISVRGLAVASASAVTAVGSVVGAASPGTTQTNDAEATAAGSTLLADLPAGQQAQVQTASLTQQADAQAVQADASARKGAEEAARRAAAETAVAKKEAAEKAAKERTEAKTAPAHSSAVVPAKSSYTVAEIQAIARQIVPSGQFQCFSNIVDRESGWNMQALNASSGAYGLMQALPGYKYAAAGSDWHTNPATQIKWGLNYMNSTYGSPCQAWSFWQTHHAY
ncbi:transglycosylase SLT domain-containing protein [Streptomyces guryensis]|uniref:Transglycosylase SLT domain-containing protein n=1 Tax=Streptomyces guryensis TaxID=2886947 RepID=A0A9Q3VZ74_9ACTN|nr:transglycosylase SLT domain-containing protein [Streptomyces guryensis]MCD9879655.1 transglycosylase SLT domain-containing protein [Streptomyces guryensis]